MNINLDDLGIITKYEFFYPNEIPNIGYGNKIYVNNNYMKNERDNLTYLFIDLVLNN